MQQGFSLVEILLVLLIVGLGASLVSLSLGGDESARELRRTAERFSALAKHASDEAVLGGEPIGLTVVPAELDSPWQYYWQRYRDGEWQPEEAPLDRWVLSPRVLLEVEVDGSAVDWALSEQEENTELPVIVFYPSGEGTVFTVTFSSEDAPQERHQVHGSIASKIDWLNDFAPLNTNE